MVEVKSKEDFEKYAGKLRGAIVMNGKPDAKDLGNGLWEINVGIANDRLIPSRTARAADKRIGLPDELTLSGPGVTVISSGPAESHLARTFDARVDRPERLPVDDGIPGNSTRWFRFVVKAAPGSEAALDYRGQKVKAIHTTVKMGS